MTIRDQDMIEPVVPKSVSWIWGKLTGSKPHLPPGRHPVAQGADLGAHAALAPDRNSFEDATKTAPSASRLQVCSIFHRLTSRPAVVIGREEDARMLAGTLYEQFTFSLPAPDSLHAARVLSCVPFKLPKKGNF
jgi:hypothetical protein